MQPTHYVQSHREPCSAAELALRQAIQEWARPRLDDLLKRFELSGRKQWEFALWLRGEYMRQRGRP